jgi:hypothetical protein
VKIGNDLTPFNCGDAQTYRFAFDSRQSTRFRRLEKRKVTVLSETLSLESLMTQRRERVVSRQSCELVDMVRPVCGDHRRLLSDRIRLPRRSEQPVS